MAQAEKLNLLILVDRHKHIADAFSAIDGQMQRKRLLEAPAPHAAPTSSKEIQAFCCHKRPIHLSAPQAKWNLPEDAVLLPEWWLNSGCCTERLR